MLVKLKVTNLDVLKDHNSDCYFCNAEEDEKLFDCDFKDDFAEDTLTGLKANKSGIKHENDSGKLGTACRDEEPETLVLEELGSDKPCDVEFAAHHLIPGEGSLTPSLLLKGSKKFMRIQGQAKGNIGYNINAKANGVWLPGSYAYSAKGKWGKGGIKFKKKTGIEPMDYAWAAIENAKVQYHDSHGDYNKFVKLKLDTIYHKLDKNEKQVINWCPKVAKKTKDAAEDMRRLVALVNRLASVSLRMRRMLEFPHRNWFVNVFTSTFAKKWMTDEKKKNRAIAIAKP